MQHPQIDDLVMLLQDIPELDLHHGDMGIVRNIWAAPHPACEVEFNPMDIQKQTRAILPPEKIEVQSPSPFDEWPEPGSGRSLYF